MEFGSKDFIARPRITESRFECRIKYQSKLLVWGFSNSVEVICKICII